MAEKEYLDYEGTVELVAKIKEYIGDAGKLELKGKAATVASLPALNLQKVGWMYTVIAAGKTTADFTDGAGLEVAANSEVAAVKVEGETENTIFSVDDGTTYLAADLTEYTPTGAVGSATKLCDAYIAASTDAGLTEGDLYITDDNGSSFYHVTALGETVADFTKTQVADETALETLNTKYGDNEFVDLNKYTETVTGEVMKWLLIGPVFDVSDKLTFGDGMPSDPNDGDTFLYMGETTYVYTPVTPEVGDDPAALGWYHSTDGETWELATEHEADTATYQYATKDEQYVTGVIYKYNLATTSWVAQSSGDTMVPISKAKIDALFD